jgi:hypothetical protein
MADDRVYIRVTPENIISIGLLSMVSLFGLVLGKQVIRMIRRATGDTVDHDPPKGQDDKGGDNQGKDN